VGAIEDIAAERARQVTDEGWSSEHDDGHRSGQLANAAACYASTQRPFKAVERAGRAYEAFTSYEDLWPWGDHWWKPADRRRDLVRAGALIVAEIERLDRLSDARERSGHSAHPGPTPGSPLETKDTSYEQ
jgi:hypothetical protein